MRCTKNHFIDNNDGVEGSYRLSMISGGEKPLENGSTTVTAEAGGTGRAQWDNKIEFLMSCVAFSVGLGNVWRFPYTAYQNGGGAFLVPYIIVLFIVGKPIYYLEMTLGQFSSRSCVQVWSISPAFRGISSDKSNANNLRPFCSSYNSNNKSRVAVTFNLLFSGIGYGVMISVFLVVTYYCSLMALAVYYLLASFQSVLPWSFCWEEWKDICFDSAPTDREIVENISSKSSSADLYFRKVVLNEIGILEGLGYPSWKLVLSLFASWMFVFIVLSNGVKSSGKAAYFLALFPYVIMISLLIRAVTLEGAVDGIIFLFKPTWEKIFDPSVWYAAVTQSFFSLGVCFGAVIMYSSYNRFDHNVLRDCTVVTIMDFGTSLIAGCTIFGILGNLAHESGRKDISTVVRAGTGLAFISYPEALAKFTVVPQLFAVLFFLMLFILGIGTTVAFTAVINSVIKDRFPNIKNWKIAAGVSSAGFVVGIVYCTRGGQYVLNLVDYFGGTFIIVFLACFELIAISWVYGVDNLLDDIEFMVGSRPSFYWRFCWYYLTPLTLLSILIYFLSELTPIRYNGEYYPTSAYVAGWLILGLGVIQLPIWMFVSKMKNEGKSYLDILKPSADWGPKDPVKFKEWKEFKDSKRIARMSLEKKRWRIVALLVGED